MTTMNPNALVTAAFTPELKDVLRSALLLERHGCKRYAITTASTETISDAFVRGFLKRWEDHRVCLTRKGMHYASLLSA